MTNAYFDEAPRKAPYAGGFEICPTCVSIVPSTYKDRHGVECAARHEAANAVEDGSAGLTVDDVQWPDGDPTA